MLPFNLISEAARTLTLAVRLVVTMMCAAMILAILQSIRPFFSRCDGGAGPADSHGAGLHLHHPGGDVHRCRYAQHQSGQPLVPEA
jgi:hypothetical protein